ncbi:MAG TPA: hypothetical protein VLA36_12040 [Longimicrobiales bacterium]|nr:hypothetical protein [Longimicrobiales bacterium]
MHDDGRRYSDEEFALILRMAAESGVLSDHLKPRSGDGLTLAEITQIAAEVGIPAPLVQRAAARLGDGDATQSSRLWGGPLRHTRRDVVAGTMDPGSLARVVDTIRDAAGQSGEVKEELGRVVWSSIGEPTQIRVSLAPDEDGTGVVVSADRNGAFVLTWTFPVLAGMVGAGITGAIIEPATVAGGVALFGGMTAGGLVVARALWGRSTRAVGRKLDAVLERTRRAVAAASQPG